MKKKVGTGQRKFSSNKYGRKRQIGFVEEILTPIWKAGQSQPRTSVDIRGRKRHPTSQGNSTDVLKAGKVSSLRRSVSPNVASFHE